MPQAMNPLGLHLKKRASEARRLTTSSGATIGIVDISKPGSAAVLRGIAEGLRAARCVTVDWPKSHSSRAHSRLKELAEQCDAVVLGVGDCGSCTSWTVRDAFDLEVAGIPSVIVVAHSFEYLAKVEATALGLPELGIVVIDGRYDPIAIQPEAALESLGASLSSRIIHFMTDTV